MILLITSIVVLVIIAGLSNSLIDTISFHYDSSIFSEIKSKRLKIFFNPVYSWMFKWKWENGKRIELKKAPWYYFFLYNPGYVESFPYSSNILSFMTDAWHLFKTIFITCFEIIIALLISYFLFDEVNVILLLISITLQKILFSLSFELGFKDIWLKK